MDIGQLIQTLVATVVGGLIVIATNWISKRGERQNAIQEWYEKTYIVEGIEPLVIYIANLNLYFYDKAIGGGLVHVKDNNTLPIQAIIRLQILFKDGIVTTIIALAHELQTSTDKKINDKACDIMLDIGTLLLSYREQLLGTIPNVKKKHSVKVPSHLVEELKNKADELAKLAGHDSAKL